MPRAKASVTRRTPSPAGRRSSTAARRGWRAWWPVVVAGAIFAVLAFAAVWRFSLLSRSGPPAPDARDGADFSISYVTEQGEGAPAGVVNSPVVISLRIPRSYEATGTVIAAVELSFVDAGGNPAQYGGKILRPFLVQPTIAKGTWSYTASIPGVPGTYYARAQLKAGATRTLLGTFDLTGFPLQAAAETGSPLVDGYVVILNNDLWKLSPDLTRRRRLTFFDPETEFVDSPVWSPDGTTLAYTYGRRADAGQTPGTHIWRMQADGSAARELAGHEPNQSLLYPTWAADGKSLYFTVETGAADSPIRDFFGVPVGERHTEWLDLGSGMRTTIVASASMLVSNPAAAELVYLEDVPPQDLATSSQLQYRLVRRPAPAAPRYWLTKTRIS